MPDIKLVAAQVFSLFCMMLIGIVARLCGVLKKDSTKLLSSVLVNITQPLMILCSLQISYTPERLKTGLHFLMLSAVFHLVLSIISRLIYGRKKGNKALEFGLIFANCGFLGFPVLKVLFGDEGLFYGAFFTLFFNIYNRTYGIRILTRDKKGKLWTAFINPGSVASVIGILLFVFKINIPAPIFSALDAVGDITFPLSMIIVGNLACNLTLGGVLRLRSFIFSALKLLAVPALTLCVCLICRMNATSTLFLTVMGAMPAGAITAVFAELYNADAESAASAVTVSTFLSIGTIPLMVFIADKALNFFG